MASQSIFSGRRTVTDALSCDIDTNPALSAWKTQTVQDTVTYSPTSPKNELPVVRRSSNPDSIPKSHQPMEDDDEGPLAPEVDDDEPMDAGLFLDEWMEKPADENVDSMTGVSPEEYAAEASLESVRVIHVICSTATCTV